MKNTRRAVIDIGTNSVKLLVAEVAGQDVRPLWEDSRQTRLGQGFYDTHRLQADPVEKTAQVVARFAETAREWKAAHVRVIATSAARDAKNPEDLITAVERESGLRMEIISGDREADWTFQGVTTDHELAKQPLLILDAGGGSTEFILGHGTHKPFRRSFPIGTVRLLEKLPHSDPPKPEELDACRAWLWHMLDHKVRPVLEPALRREARFDPVKRQVRLVGTGGTTGILARMEASLEAYDRERIEATRLSLARINAHVRRLWSLPLEERRRIVGLPKKRADVILTGVLIYESVMELFGFDELRVTTRGLRFAAVMDGD